MRWVILSGTVVTFRLQLKIAVITYCQRGCFSNTRWNRVCAGVATDIFPDFEICSFISARVKKVILVRSMDQPSDGYFGCDSPETLAFTSLLAAFLCSFLFV